MEPSNLSCREQISCGELRLTRACGHRLRLAPLSFSPGLTSPTAYLPPAEDNIPVDRAVAVFAYGKEEPLAIGLTKMSTDDIRSVNKNIGVDNVHYLGDDLWNLDRI